MLGCRQTFVTRRDNEYRVTGPGERRVSAHRGQKVRNFNKNDGARHVASLPAQPYPELHTGAGSSRRLRGPPPLSWGHFLIPFPAPHTQHPSLPHHSKHLHVLMCHAHVHHSHTLFPTISQSFPPAYVTTNTPTPHPPAIFTPPPAPHIYHSYHSSWRTTHQPQALATGTPSHPDPPHPSVLHTHPRTPPHPHQPHPPPHSRSHTLPPPQRTWTTHHGVTPTNPTPQPRPALRDGTRLNGMPPVG